MLDHLLDGKVQAQSVTGFEHLLEPRNLDRVVKNYLIACKVEGKSPRTIEAYGSTLNRFIEQLESPIVTVGDIRGYLLSLQERGLKPSLIHRHYRGLKTFFNWLVTEELLVKSPMHNVKPPKVPREIIHPFSPEDIENLLLLCSGRTSGARRFLDIRNRAMILLFLDTGLRLSELAAIRLQDINFNNETIHVLGKGSKERIVRIGRTVQKALLAYLRLRTDDYHCLWLTEEKRPLKRDGIKIAIRRLCKRAGITDAKPGAHTFRHTAAINYLRNKGDQFTLQIMLGHSTLEMTRRYVSSLSSADMIEVHKTASPVDNMDLK